MITVGREHIKDQQGMVFLCGIVGLLIWTISIHILDITSLFMKHRMFKT